MESFELALAHILVQREGYTWFPPGVLFAEPALFKSKSGRGTLLRLVRAETVSSLPALLTSSFTEAEEILHDHSYQGITVIQLLLYESEPTSAQVSELRTLERHEMVPEVAVYTSWFTIGKNADGPNAEKNVLHSNIPWFAKGALPQSAVLEAASLPASDDNTAELQQEIVQTIEQRRNEWRNVFVQQSSKAVYSLLVIIIGMFLWMLTKGPIGSPHVLLYFGAKANELIIAGEYWRLITPMFLHVSTLHLLVNALALYSLRDAEWIYGSYRFLFVFLMAGIAGNIASFAFSPALAAGASGGLFGVMGSLLYFGTQRKEFFKRTMSSAVWSTLVINLALGVMIPQISNSGHIGGLIGGFLAAAAVGLPGQRMRPYQIPALFVLLVLMAAGIVLGFQLWR